MATSTTRARREQVNTAIANMTPDQVHCRDYGHSWAPHTARREGRLFTQVLRCVRCQTRRHRTLDATGDVVSSHYDYSYAEGYRVTGLGHLDSTDRGLMRLASILDTLREQ
jgi:hypothetical protein